MYNDLVKKVSEAENPFKEMGGEELSKVEAEEKAREAEYERKRQEKIAKKKAELVNLSFICPHCKADLRESGVTEVANEYRYQNLDWDEEEGWWRWGDSDYGDSDHVAWRCNNCNDDILHTDFHSDYIE